MPKLEWCRLAVEVLTLGAVIWYAWAAQESNGINKRSSDLAYRPYIGENAITPVHAYQDSTGEMHLSKMPTPSTNLLDFSAEIKNFGPVPGAHSVNGWRIFLGGQEQPTTKVPDTPFTFFPGQTKYFTGQIGTKDYPSVISGQRQLIIEVTAEYDGPNGHYKECVKSQFSPDINGFSSWEAATHDKMPPSVSRPLSRPWEKCALNTLELAIAGNELTAA